MSWRSQGLGEKPGIEAMNKNSLYLSYQQGAMIPNTFSRS
jgi:hypothetical protein